MSLQLPKHSAASSSFLFKNKTKSAKWKKSHIVGTHSSSSTRAIRFVWDLARPTAAAPVGGWLDLSFNRNDEFAKQNQRKKVKSDSLFLRYGWDFYVKIQLHKWFVQVKATTTIASGFASKNQLFIQLLHAEKIIFFFSFLSYPHSCCLSPRSPPCGY